MTAITARLAKWSAHAWAFLASLGTLVFGVGLYFLRNKRRAFEVLDEGIEKIEARGAEATARHDTAIAIINAKDAAAKRELREIKREPDWRTRMERMRELKERVMKEGKS